MFRTGFLELPHDAISLGGLGIDWYQVVIVQVDTPCPNLREHLHNVYRRKGRTHGFTKRISPAVTQRP